MKRTVLNAALGITLLGLAVWVGGGDLFPPPGPIGSTMKTLSEIEVRIAINSVNTPGDGNSLFKIAASGSYYLTGDTTGVAGKHGIEVAASNVKIDLQGYTLAGVSGTLDGIIAGGGGSTLTGIRIANGTVCGWDGYQINARTAERVNVDDCEICGGGKGMAAGTGAGVNGSSAAGLEGTAFELGAGSVIFDTRVVGSGGDAFVLGDGSEIRDCVAFDVGGTGISVGSASTVRAVLVTRAAGTGIVALDDCEITDCLVSTSGADGIRVGANCLVTRNLSNHNAAGNGIATTGGGNRLEFNQLNANARGIRAGAAGNFITNNTLDGNSKGPQYNGEQILEDEATAQAAEAAANAKNAETAAKSAETAAKGV